jgi:hypothetical protein
LEASGGQRLISEPRGEDMIMNVEWLIFPIIMRVNQDSRPMLMDFRYICEMACEVQTPRDKPDKTLELGL